MTKLWITVSNFFLQTRIVFGVYVLLAVIASLQAILLPAHFYAGVPYTEYNNYVIFKNSFYHLLAGKNLYILYPNEQWDLYKYSPSFALGMGLLAHLPDWLGVTAWNLCNALALFFAVQLLPFKERTRSVLLWFLMLELLTSLQNTQSNGIMAALFVAAYGCLRRGKISLAVLWVVIATFIKVYGIIGVCLFLFYPDKVKSAGYFILWTLLFAVLPVVVIPFSTLLWQYHNWANMMAADQSASYGLSVMGWLHSWFGINNGKAIVTVTGVFLFLIPFARFRLYRNEVYKLLMLAFMLTWVIIFNHKAESPTYIIAITGVGTWYFLKPPQLWRRVLLAAAFIFTCLSPTDVFPPFVREHFFQPYTIKAIPCMLIWVVIFIELMLLKKDEQLPATNLVT
jgi:hypothetical protein